MPFDKNDINNNNENYEEVNNNIIYFSESPDFSKNNILEIDAAGQLYDNNNNYPNKPTSIFSFNPPIFGNSLFHPIFINNNNGGLFANTIQIYN